LAVVAEVPRGHEWSLSDDRSWQGVLERLAE
jgi:hypothetical protein